MFIKLFGLFIFCVINMTERISELKPSIITEVKPVLQKEIVITLPVEDGKKVLEVLKAVRGTAIGGAVSGYCDDDWWCGNGPRPWPRRVFEKVNQVLVKDAEVSGLLAQGYVFKAQLSSGLVVLEKSVSVNSSLDVAIGQLEKQII
jgi:hypothetical protein